MKRLRSQDCSSIDLANANVAKHAKYSQTNNVQTLPPEIMYEIFNYLPSRVILAKCMSVSKEWAEMIKNGIELSFDVDDHEWSCLCASDEDIIKRVTNLSIRVRPAQTRNLDLEFYGFYLLKKIQFTDVVVDKYTMKNLLENTTIQEIIIDDCDLDLSAINSIASKRPDVLLSIKTSDISNADVEDFTDTISRIKCLKVLHVPEEYSIECLDDKVNLFNTISQSRELSEVSLDFDDVTVNYLPKMKNLTSLNVSCPAILIEHVPDLRALKKLTSIISNNGLCQHENYKNGCLEPIMEQLTSITASSTHLTHEERVKLGTLGGLKHLFYRISKYDPLTSLPTGLTHLDLCYSVISPSVMEQIRKMDKLKVLRLGDTELVESDSSTRLITFKDICHEENGSLKCDLSQLRHLQIGWPSQDTQSMRVIQSMGKLKDLVFHNSQGKQILFQKDCIHYISLSESISRLSLRDINLSIQDMENIASMKQLTTLSLENIPLEDDHIRVIRSNNDFGMNSLKSLTIQSRVSEKSVADISRIKSIEQLSISVNNIYRSLVECIASMKRLRCVAMSCVENYRAFNVGLKRLKPDIAIVSTFEPCFSIDPTDY